MSTRHSETMQRDALAAVGCTAIYVAGQDSWKDFVGELRKGETVCMTTLDRVSSHRTDLAPARRDVHAKGCHIWEVATGRRSTSADDMAEMMAAAIAAQTGDARALPPKLAKKYGRRGGEAKGESAKQGRTSVELAKPVWTNDSMGTKAERLAHPHMKGWTRTSAFRHLSPKNRKK